MKPIYAILTRNGHRGRWRLATRFLYHDAPVARREAHFRTQEEPGAEVRAELYVSFSWLLQRLRSYGTGGRLVADMLRAEVE